MSVGNKAPLSAKGAKEQLILNSLGIVANSEKDRKNGKPAFEFPGEVRFIGGLPSKADIAILRSKRNSDCRYRA